MNDRNSKRRHVFIKKAFQTRFIIGVLGLILLSSLSSALFIYWVTGGDLQAQSQSAHANIVNAWERLGLSIVMGNLVAVAIAGVTGVTSVLYASHKIAGPLYRFEKLCEEVSNGNLNPVTQLREDDQLQELAQSFAKMVDKLSQRRDHRERLLETIDQHIRSMVDRNGENLSDDLRNTVETLAKLADELKNLDKFPQ